jgi:hypothetical protein
MSSGIRFSRVRGRRLARCCSPTLSLSGDCRKRTSDTQTLLPAPANGIFFCRFASEIGRGRRRLSITVSEAIKWGRRHTRPIHAPLNRSASASPKLLSNVYLLFLFRHLQVQNPGQQVQ